MSDLVPFIVPIIFYGLGTFVCFMQAFVPTVLTMIYIMLIDNYFIEDRFHLTTTRRVR
jgi:F0F1-type ATP synthase membrane subunit a